MARGGGGGSNRDNGGGRRRGSVDSRTVEMQLRREEDSERARVVADARELLSRENDGRMPGKAEDRWELVDDLARVASFDGLEPQKAAEAVELAWRVTARSKTRGEMSRCLEASLPTVLAHLGSGRAHTQQASVRFLLDALVVGDCDEQVIAALAGADGIGARDRVVSCECARLVPGLFVAADERDLDLTPVVTALYDQLDSKSRQPSAFAALIRHQNILGSKKFRDLSENASEGGRNLLDRLKRSVKEEEADLLRKRQDRDGVSFGIVPNSLINKMLDTKSRRDRAEGALLLRRELDSAPGRQVELLEPYAGSLFKFLGMVVAADGGEDQKVVLHCLECHLVALHRMRRRAARPHAETVVDNLMDAGAAAEVTPQVKAETYRAAREAMVCAGASEVADLVLEDLGHRNPRTREDVLLHILHALLTFPSTDFDLNKLIRRIVPALSDQKRRVRQGSLECMAVLGSLLGPRRSQAIYDAVEDSHADEDSLGYDTSDDVTAAIKCRLGRRHLPKITDEGFVEYGLLIPQNLSGEKGGKGGGGGRRQRNGGGPSSSSSVEGDDVDWVLKATGGISRGTVGTGSAGSAGRSTLSVRRSSTGLNDRSKSMEEDGGGGGGRGNGRGVFNRTSRIPDIGTGGGSRRSRSDSPRRHDRRRSNSRDRKNDDPKYDHPLDAFAAGGGADDPADDGPDDDEIKDRWRLTTPGGGVGDARVYGDGDAGDGRRGAYSTKSRFESMLDLRAAARTPPSDRMGNRRRLEQVGEEEEEDEDRRSPRRKGSGDKRKNDRSGGGEPSFKKVSLAEMGLPLTPPERRAFLFDDDPRLDDNEAPGAFKRPSEAYKAAKRDLDSKDWKTEVDGLDALVRLLKYHPEVILGDLKNAVRAVLHECRNLRSQVTRAAVQTAALMFAHLGRRMEEELREAPEDVAEMLFTKTADTNRFIRKDALESLDVVIERLSVHRAVSVLSRVGARHKNTVARTCTASLLGRCAERLGADRLFRRRDGPVVDNVVNTGIKLLLDGSLDTRTEAKRIFAVLSDHPEYEDMLEDVVRPKSDLERAKKALKSVKSK